MSAPGVQVLEDPNDEERILTEEEIREYAEFLGIDVDKEPHLMWIAKEGVAAPVPPPWKACTQNGDDVFYFNFETSESVWDHPCDEKYRRMVEEEREKQDASTAGKDGEDKAERTASAPEVVRRDVSDSESSEESGDGGKGKSKSQSRTKQENGATEKGDPPEAAHEANEAEDVKDSDGREEDHDKEGTSREDAVREFSVLSSGLSDSALPEEPSGDRGRQSRDAATDEAADVSSEESASSSGSPKATAKIEGPGTAGPKAAVGSDATPVRQRGGAFDAGPNSESEDADGGEEEASGSYEQNDFCEASQESVPSSSGVGSGSLGQVKKASSGRSRTAEEAEQSSATAALEASGGSASSSAAGRSIEEPKAGAKKTVGLIGISEDPQRRLEVNTGSCEVSGEIEESICISEQSSLGASAGAGGDAAAGRASDDMPARQNLNDSPAHSERGLAGVGLAPAKAAPDVPDVVQNASGGSSDREKPPETSASASHNSNSRSHSQSAGQGPLIPLQFGPSSRVGGGERDRLDQSGQSISRSSAASEVSEDFPSDFGASEREGDRGTALGDTLELSGSASMMEEPTTAVASDSAALDAGKRDRSAQQKAVNDGKAAAGAPQNGARAQSMPSVTVLEEPNEEDRVLSEEEINEYADFLGIDVQKEPHLMWIAREGVSAPVPPPWKACAQNQDDVFYFNFETEESTWDHPCDEKYKALVVEERAKHKAKLEAESAPQPKGSPGKVPVSGSLADTRKPLAAGDAAAASAAKPAAESEAAKGGTVPSADGSPEAAATAAEEQRLRLALITSEISDEEDICTEAEAGAGGDAAAGASGGAGTKTPTAGGAAAGPSVEKGLDDATELPGGAGVGSSTGTAKPPNGSGLAAKAAAPAASVSASGGTQTASARWRRIEADVASLGRVLTMLKEIREQQQEYLKLLCSGLEPGV